nr:MAG TPA_asm: hypothetical protein [Caudoviricetes sp.]
MFLIFRNGPGILLGMSKEFTKKTNDKVVGTGLR